MIAVKEKPATTTPPKVIRHPEFAKRLDSACDSIGHCPPKHKGRQSWVMRELKTRFKEEVTPETVRKWFAGEAMPRPDKTALLAEMLMVDVAWLQIGVDPDMTPRDRKARNAVADGAVNAVAGFIQMDGGHPAFPKGGHPVDLHAIIRGAKYDFHICTADADGHFHVPVDNEELIVLGVTRGEGFCLEIYELTPDVIEKHGNRRGGSIEVTVPTKKLRRVESFSNRL